MRLHRFAYSCYARFVQATLDLAGASYAIVDVPFGDRDDLARLTGGYIQVPVVELDDGTVVTDSRRIVATLVRDDARFAPLVPAAQAAAVWAYVDWANNQLEDVAFRIATPGLQYRFTRPWERALFVFIKERKYGAGCVDAWYRDADNLAARLDELLAPTIAGLASRPFVLGDTPTLADAALYGHIVMMEFGKPDRVAALHPAIHAWRQRLEEKMGAPPYGRRAREHRTRTAMDAALAAASETSAARTGRLDLIVLRTAVDQRACPDEASFLREAGLAGDHWAVGGKPSAQVSLVDIRIAGAIAHRDDWQLMGDNLFVDLDISEGALRPGDRLALGGALLEITDEPHRGCRKYMSRFGADALRWVNAKDRLADRRRGVYARVIEGGAIRIGDTVARR
jgi:glutathione S-transferase